MRLSLLLSILLIAFAGLMTLTLWQHANVQVRQQALQLRINALRSEQEPQDSPASASELQRRQERLDELQRELNSIKAQGGAR